MNEVKTAMKVLPSELGRYVRAYGGFGCLETRHQCIHDFAGRCGKQARCTETDAPRAVNSS